MKAWLQQLNELEAPLCRAWSRQGGDWIQRFFAVVSRLGDGVFWYSLIAVLALSDGRDGLLASLHMLGVGGVALALYRAVKGLTRRERPCHSLEDLAAAVAPLDRYSFPSGHTLHAVSFTTVAVYYYPELAWILIPFTLLVAGSRVILGLHFPSDVLVAGGLGLALAFASILIVS